MSLIWPPDLYFFVGNKVLLRTYVSFEFYVKVAALCRAIPPAKQAFFKDIKDLSKACFITDQNYWFEYINVYLGALTEL